MAGIGANSVTAGWSRRLAGLLPLAPGIGVGLGLVLVSYFNPWRRGPYSGDYSYLRSSTFPARVLNWIVATTFARMVADHELLVRVLLAAGVGLSAALVGWLVLRLTGSRPAAFAAAWLATVPAYAPEAVLVADAATFVFGIGATVAFLHLALTASRRHSPRWAFAAALLMAVAMLQFDEAAVAAVPLAAGFWVLDPASRPRRRGRLGAWMAGSLIAVAFTAITILSSPLPAKRGGFDLAPGHVIHLAGVNLNQLRFLLLSETWAKPLLAEAFGVGWGALGGWVPWAAAALAGGGIALALTATAKGADRPASPPALRVPLGPGAALVLGGIALGLLAVLLPGVAEPGYIVDPRLLYLPWVALALSAGGLVALSQRLRPELPFIAAVATVAVAAACALVLAGWSTALGARSRADTRQLAALTAAAPSSVLPAGAYLVPVVTEEGLLGRDPNTDPLAKAPFGVFETPWSARAAIDSAYRRPDLQVVTMSRWQPMTFAPLAGDDLLIDSTRLPPAACLLFTFLGGRLVAIESLDFGAGHILDLPIAGVLRRRGTPTIVLHVSAGAPVMGTLP